MPTPSSFRRQFFHGSIKALAASSLTLGALASLQPAARADIFWNVQTGDYGTAGNWSTSTVPGTGDNADVVNGGTLSITTNQSSNDLNAGGYQDPTAANGTINMTAGTFNAGSNGGWMRLGYVNANGNDVATGATTGTLNISGGTLNLTQLNGNAGGQVNLGEYSGATGNLNISGTGTFNLTTAGVIQIGDNRNINGSGGGTGNMTVGSTTGTATLNLTQSGSFISVGQGSTGNFTLNSGGAVTNQGQLWIANGTADGLAANGTGVMTINGGTYAEHNWLAVGRQGGNGTLNINGGTLTVDNTAANAGNSHFDIAGGGGNNNASVGLVNQTAGSVTVSGNTMWFGENGSTANSATYNLSGGTLTAGAGIVMGQSGAGSATFNLNGGTLATTGFQTGAGTGTKLVIFNGGTLQATAANTAFLNGTETVNNAAVTPGSLTAAVVSTGGAKIDTNGFNITFATALQNAGGADGGLTKLGGTGTLTLAGVNTYTGATTVNAGVLLLAATGSINTTSSVSIGGAGALTLQGTATLPDSGLLSLASGAALNLDATGGGTETVGQLVLNGTNVALGTYTAQQLTTQYGSSGVTFESANGETITVTAVPEPSTWALGVFGLGLAGVLARRRQTVGAV